MGNKRRVAAYCRVSSDAEDQLHSLRAQQRYFAHYIKDRPDWQLVEIYADEGVSGTSTNKRARFNEMVERALGGGIDIVLTKDVSRFARNTLDTLRYTRLLRERGVGVVFINDNIDTLDGEGEFRLSIMASVAQEESRKTSQRVRWGQRRAMEQGTVFGNNSIWGYDIKAGRLAINEPEAEVVRLIFHKYAAEKKGCRMIARELDEAGIRPRRAARWSQQSVLRILKNEKYVGDLVQQKHITPDFLSHKKQPNPDDASLVVKKSNHPAIIDEATWKKAQAILKRRSKQQKSYKIGAGQ